jgi:ribose transport system permease protein
MALVILLGAAIGWINGLFVIGFGIPSFIVTLAMLAGYRSLALIISSERPFTPRGRDLFFVVTGGDLFGHIPWLIVWMVPVVIIGGIALSMTRFGYHVYATGGNREAAEATGINVRRVRFAVFMLTGALCGLAAALVFGYLRAAAPTTGIGFEFRVIGAVVVGGTALTGGRGSILGTLLGAIIIGMITGGMVLFGYSQNIGDMATGLLIILVGSLDLGLRRHLRHHAR